MAELLELAPVNPFAVVVMAQLEANANHPDALRLIHKEALVRRLYDWGFRRERQEGMKEGVAEVLAALVTQKFGLLPNWARARIADADEAALNRWTLKILDAQHIEDVFM